MVTEKHFVTFISPGTLFHETTTKPIDSWDPCAAAAMARDVVERYGAKPFGFRFSTRLCSDPVDDGRGGTLEVMAKDVRASGIHYINGTVLSLAKVEARGDAADRILINNMKGNGISHVVEVVNGYRSCHEFRADDCIVDQDGVIVRRSEETT